eukprot:CAMPEP_0197712264 /NCGR_PEP_ID=MMETSP1338-20131121/129868_1 /TAXON_ID=43686 ORGANISM="Pelagodinium beii, Strain RCC1491" /NCGR_SAMPLE_ID=MMETSP1338 /ASSEMBLY_ACC=CAM_ASM_000754 /LENGTH=191 /DNA_ID=CAMNT_0043296199 /DNA_START=709 /DNA_END=1285 /DNA_ORIENTATION=+
MHSLKPPKEESKTEKSISTCLDRGDDMQNASKWTIPPKLILSLFVVQPPSDSTAARSALGRFEAAKATSAACSFKRDTWEVARSSDTRDLQEANVAKSSKRSFKIQNLEASRVPDTLLRLNSMLHRARVLATRPSATSSAQRRKAQRPSRALLCVDHLNRSRSLALRADALILSAFDLSLSVLFSPRWDDK